MEKHENLERKYEKFIKKQRKNKFECSKCGDKFETLKNFQDDNEDCCSNFEYKCEECEKCFKDENKLQNHRDKMHVKFECDECEKVFKYEAVLEKHKEATHEDFQLFCHYDNNDKDCPFDDECMYIHEDSENCKFGGNCARSFCMYKQEESADKSTSRI